MQELNDPPDQLHHYLNDLRRRVDQLKSLQYRHREAEERLRESELRLRRLAEASFEGIVIHDHGILLDCNDAFAKLFGLTIKEVIGKKASDLVSDDSKSIVNEKIAHHSEAPYEVHGVKRNGEDFLLEIRGRRILEDGKPLRISVLRDITLQRKMENELRDSRDLLEEKVKQRTRELLEINEKLSVEINERELTQSNLEMSEKRYRLLVESTDVIPWEFDSSSGRFSYIGPQAENLFAYSIDELKAEGFWESILHPEDKINVSRLRKECFEERKSNTLEYRIITNEGETVWVRDVLGAPDEENSNKRRGFFIDMTENRRAQEENRRLAAFPTENPNCIFEALNTGELVYSNPSALKLMDELDLVEAKELLPSNHIDLMKKCCEEKLPIVGIEVIINDRVFECSYFPVKLLDRVHIYCVDRTEEYTIEQKFKKQNEMLIQSQKMEVVGKLAGGVAHDFGNMLTIIQGYSEIILNKMSPDDTFRNYMEQISLAGIKASALTSQLLTFSRQQKVRSQEIDLVSHVSEMKDLMARLIGENIILDFNQPLSPLSKINVDPGLLGQVVMNLVVNARDAIVKSGMIKIDFQELNVDASRLELNSALFLHAVPGNFLLMKVTDTGEGIPPEVMDRIFEPFFTTKEVGKGTGLGLSTVFGIVNQFAGFIEIDSEVGKGSEFRVFLPVANAMSSQVEEMIHENLRGDEAILLVEADEEAMRKMLSALQDHGYRVFAAKGPEEAHDIFKIATTPIDLLICDVYLPTMTGKLFHQILSRTQQALPVLFVTEIDDEVELNGATKQYLYKKPVERASLLKSVRSVFDDGR